MKHSVFVDGHEGTTGLQIHERLAGRHDIEILHIDPELRKNTEARRRLLNTADIVFLCLPDEAAKEAVSLVSNSATRVIDASTAHRTHPDWAYGLPELSPAHREKIRNSRRVAVTGCHASGFIASLYPLVSAGMVSPDLPISCFSLTGYSGGGKKMIAEYEAPDRSPYLESPRLYALGLTHKHLPEMQQIVGLSSPPNFTPIVADVYKGMIVSIPLASRVMNGSPNAKQVHEVLSRHFAGQHFVRVRDFDPKNGAEDGYLHMMACNGTNFLEIAVFGNEEHILVTARLDNLGKGASGAAVQCMNIMIDADERTGLE